MNDLASHERFMRMALGLAARGAGRVSPNPMVGAVLVRDGEVVARGWHRAAGLDHAEIDALKAVDRKADGCDLYVTLEPCCHQGRTPPCTVSIAESGVKRVFVAMIDPNPLVSGKGVRELRDSGIEVVTGVLEDRARALNAPFAKWVETGRPFVTLKMASTLDGRIAQRDGGARWISSPRSRKLVHRLRSESDCVMVGAGTASLDDPLLLPTAVGTGGTPLRAVVDEKADLEPESRLAASAGDSGVILFTSTRSDEGRRLRLKEAGVDVVTIEEEGGLVPLEPVLDELGRREVLTVLVEGGAGIAASLIGRGLVDRFILFIAPKLLGDPSARSLVDDLGIRTLDGSARFDVTATRRVGPDVMIDMKPGTRSGVE